MTYDMTGERHGRLVVVRCNGPDTRGELKWLCDCDCGGLTAVAGSLLRRGVSKSCGCLRREMSAALGKASQRHGEAKDGSTTAEYRTWGQMLSRCNNPNHKLFRHYGARGIRVVRRWTTFENFLEDMGRRTTPKHSLDRVDNNGDYGPGNCRWATSTQQNNNQRKSRGRVPTVVTISGREQLLTDWLKEARVSPRTYYRRKAAGMPDAEALGLAEH